SAGVAHCTRTEAGRTWRCFLVRVVGCAFWMCFRCDARGDAIAFVQRVDGLSFREAASRLGADLSPRNVTLGRSAPVRNAVRRFAHSRPIDTEVLAAAVELYANRLMADETALRYLAARGFGRELLERERIGFAA